MVTSLGPSSSFFKRFVRLFQPSGAEEQLLGMHRFFKCLNQPGNHNPTGAVEGSKGWKSILLRLALQMSLKEALQVRDDVSDAGTVTLEEVGNVGRRTHD